MIEEHSISCIHSGGRERILPVAWQGFYPPRHREDCSRYWFPSLAHCWTPASLCKMQLKARCNIQGDPTISRLQIQLLYCKKNHSNCCLCHLWSSKVRTATLALFQTHYRVQVSEVDCRQTIVFLQPNIWSLKSDNNIKIDPPEKVSCNSKSTNIIASQSDSRTP